MPFKGDKFLQGQLRKELNALTRDDERKKQLLWAKVLDRYNKDTKAEAFIRLVVAQNVLYDGVMCLLTYEPKLKDVTPANLASCAAAAVTAHYKATIEIPGYFGSLVKATDKHREGKFTKVLEVGKKYERPPVVYQIYRNSEGFLPPAEPGDIYIEWYPSGHSERRFFTISGHRGGWFTDGGTHADADFWYTPDPDETKPLWKRCYLATVE